MVEPLFCNIKNKSTIYRYISTLFGVCSYFIVEKDQVIIIDPGKYNKEVFNWLHNYNNFQKIVYITHEHFDHHYHANEVFKLEKTHFFSPSESFNNALNDTRKNLSHYYDDPIKSIANSIILESYLNIIKTPGHSEESYCFVYEDILFGGDTLIEKKYLIFKLPGGNRSDFNNSIYRLRQIIDSRTIVLPGHGDLFYFDEWKI
jgi:glyoxylase-like metal-dependent hydrolase (beta-lactamase superfamily II)